MAAEDEEVNEDGSGQVYVPCIWKAVSIYSHKTKRKIQSWYLVLSTLADLGSWNLDIALGALGNVIEEFPGGPGSRGLWTHE